MSLYSDNSPCMVFGANSYSHIDENSNSTELKLHEFKLYEKSKLLAHHTCDDIIFNKSIDKTAKYHLSGDALFNTSSLVHLPDSAVNPLLNI